MRLFAALRDPVTRVRPGHQPAREGASERFGAIGWPLPGTEVRLDRDGELLVKGAGVMRGDHGQPAATAEVTTEVTTEDGFFRTGDIAEIDERGFIKITDRKKAVFKTSGGKYIAPSLIEARFKGLCPYVSQFLVVVGDGRNYASALVTLDADSIGPWAAAHGMVEATYAEIAASDATRAMIQGYVDELNAGLNRWEIIKRFAILHRDLTVEDGELTPSLKLKRRVAIDHFEAEVAALYDPVSAGHSQAPRDVVGGGPDVQQLGGSTPRPGHGSAVRNGLCLSSEGPGY